MTNVDTIPTVRSGELRRLSVQAAAESGHRRHIHLIHARPRGDSIMVHVTCPQCGKHYNLGDEFAGKKGRCPACQAIFSIPAAGNAPPPPPQPAQNGVPPLASSPIRPARIDAAAPPPDDPMAGLATAMAAPAPHAPAAVSPRMIDSLRRTRPWVIFLAVLGFIGSGGGVLLGLVMIIAGIAASGSESGIIALAGVLYIVVCGIMFIPAYLLVTYGSKIGHLLKNHSATLAEAAIDAQRAYWKFMGIMAIVLIGLNAIIFFIMMIAGMIAAGSGGGGYHRY